MGKLTIKPQKGTAREIGLKLGDMSVGRSSSCDIVLKDDKSVSSRHALIKTVGNKSTIEDLNSTNGTFIDTKRIQKHELAHGETIIIGEYQMLYRDVVALDAPAFGQPTKSAVPTNVTSQENTRVITGYPQLIALDGKDTGKHLPLMKEETLLDNPGKNPARISRTAHGYLLTAQVGPGEPRLNDKPVPPSGQLLETGDIISVAGTRFQVNI